jgi:hypothetical protein
MALLEKLIILRHSYLVAVQFGGFDNAINSFRKALFSLDYGRKEAIRLVGQVKG